MDTENLIKWNTKEQNKKLVEEYPFLLPRNVFSDKLIEDYDYEFTWLDDLPDTWRDKFSEPMLKELKEILIEGNYLNEYRIMQIKEKFSTLRWYDNGIPKCVSDKYNDWLLKYEKISGEICFYCGEPAVGRTRGWILAICQECADEKDAKINYFMVAQ